MGVVGRIHGVRRGELSRRAFNRSLLGLNVAIRPEKLLLSSEKPETNANVVEGTLDNIAYLGERRHVLVRLPGAERPVAAPAPKHASVWLGAADRGRPVWLT
jgi:ABC-type Fe3+/spermidine/putrescine transport system ATPase subunit